MKFTFCDPNGSTEKVKEKRKLLQVKHELTNAQCYETNARKSVKTTWLKNINGTFKWKKKSFFRDRSQSDVFVVSFDQISHIV